MFRRSPVEFPVRSGSLLDSEIASLRSYRDHNSSNNNSTSQQLPHHEQQIRHDSHSSSSSSSNGNNSKGGMLQREHQDRGPLSEEEEQQMMIRQSGGSSSFTPLRHPSPKYAINPASELEKHMLYDEIKASIITIEQQLRAERFSVPQVEELNQAIEIVEDRMTMDVLRCEDDLIELEQLRRHRPIQFE